MGVELSDKSLAQEMLSTFAGHGVPLTAALLNNIVGLISTSRDDTDGKPLVESLREELAKKESLLLSSAIHEARRLAPGVSQSVAEAITDFDVQLKSGKVRIRNGTLLVGHHVYANRDTRFFKFRPSQFWPLRFIQDHRLLRFIVSGGGSDALPASTKDWRCPAQDMVAGLIRGVIQHLLVYWKWDPALSPVWDYDVWTPGWWAHRRSVCFKSVTARGG